MTHPEVVFYHCPALTASLRALGLCQSFELNHSFPRPFAAQFDLCMVQRLAVCSIQMAYLTWLVPIHSGHERGVMATGENCPAQATRLAT